MVGGDSQSPNILFYACYGRLCTHSCMYMHAHTYRHMHALIIIINNKYRNMIMSKQGKQMKLKYFDFEVKDSVRTSVPKE